MHSNNTMFTCNDCTRTFLKRSSLRNHIKTYATDHIDEQMRIATEELKKNKKSNENVQSLPVQYSPIIEDIIEDINDREYEDDHMIDISSDEIFGIDIIISDDHNPLEIDVTGENP